MVAIKAHQANAFLKSPNASLNAFLFYGTDPGMISERARVLSKSLSQRDDPPGEIIRIADSDLDADPDRLLIELQTIPMFGGRQVVRVSASRKITAAMLKPVLDDATPASLLIVEAANLKPSDAMRKLFEKPAHAAAIACFPDNARDIDAMIGQVLGAAKLDISRDARTLLASRLGADHALSRNELEKLALYAHGKKSISIEDIEDVVGDASEQAMDKIIVAAASGRTAIAVSECDRVIASGNSAQVIIMAAGRYFQRLHRVRGALDAGRSLDDALRQLRPPIHFKQKDAFAVQVRAWSMAQLNQALTRITSAAHQARLNAALEAALTERLLLELSRLAQAGVQRGRGR